jgi:hypothetical protein
MINSAPAAHGGQEPNQDTRTSKFSKTSTNKHVLECPMYSLRRLIDNRWITINYWDDIGHVASLLVIFGYEADMQSALDMLNILAAA